MQIKPILLASSITSLVMLLSAIAVFYLPQYLSATVTPAWSLGEVLLTHAYLLPLYWLLSLVTVLLFALAAKLSNRMAVADKPAFLLQGVTGITFIIGAALAAFSLAITHYALIDWFQAHDTSHANIMLQVRYNLRAHTDGWLVAAVVIAMTAKYTLAWLYKTWLHKTWLYKIDHSQ